MQAFDGEFIIQLLIVIVDVEPGAVNPVTAIHQLWEYGIHDQAVFLRVQQSPHSGRGKSG
ncbi:hypothetical protein D3C87_1999460 [compost metagenome]